MAYEIVWTENAVLDYKTIVEYLLYKWNEKVLDSFEKKLYHKLELIAQEPHIGINSSKFQNVKSVLITKHNRLYYRFLENKIEVLNIFDTRQNPLKNIFE